MDTLKHLITLLSLLVLPIVPSPTIVATNGGWSVTWNSDQATNYTWYLEYSKCVTGPYEWCPDAHYTNQVLSNFSYRPNHYYRLHGITQ